MEKKTVKNSKKGTPTKKSGRYYSSSTRKEFQHSISLDQETEAILQDAISKAPVNPSASKIIRYALRKTFKPWRKAIGQKIAEHQRKGQYWQNQLKEYEEVFEK